MLLIESIKQYFKVVFWINDFIFYWKLKQHFNGYSSVLAEGVIEIMYNLFILVTLFLMDCNTLKNFQKATVGDLV